MAKELQKNGDKPSDNGALKIDTKGHDNMNGPFFKSPSMSRLSDKNDVLVMSEEVLDSITRPLTSADGVYILR